MFIAVAIVAIALLIVVHELGHFAVARACGMRVERFSIGFGPVLWKTTRGETEWAVSAIPLGGYVRIAGMAAEEEVDAGDRAAYCNQPAWRRFLVILGGPGTNYLAALLLAVGLLATIGFPEANPGPWLGSPVEGGVAEKAGLRKGDHVLSVDGKPVDSWGALVREVMARPGKSMQLELERGAERLTLAVTPGDEGGVGRLGVRPLSRPIREETLVGAVRRGLAITNQAALASLEGFWKMVTFQAKGRVQGPAGIAQEMASSAREGAAPFLGAVWFISLVLAIFNLLPVPGLDGARLLVLAWEIVARRRVNPRIENLVHTVGVLALLALLVGVTLFGDLPRIFK
jgi:regulator of sigma E protease